MVTNTNIAALNSANNLRTTGSLLNLSLARLSSGSKIVSAADDPASMAESMQLTAQIGQTNATNNNVGNAIAFGQTQDGFLQQVGSALDQMATLAVSAEDATKTDAERGDYQKEFAALSTYINDVMSKNFNGVSLFSAGGLNVTTDSDGNSFQMQGITANYITPTITTSTTSTATVGYSLTTPLSQFRTTQTGDILSDQNGTIDGNLDGNIYGNLNGTIEGDMTGDVDGNNGGTIFGNLSGSVNGNLTGNIYGNVTGHINGNFSGNIYGNLTGDINGNFTGNIYGTMSGQVNGPSSGQIHNSSQASQDSFSATRGGVTNTVTVPGNGTIGSLLNALNGLGNGIGATYDAATGQLAVTVAAGSQLTEAANTFQNLGLVNSSNPVNLDNQQGSTPMVLSATLTHLGTVTTTTTSANGAPDISTTLGAASALTSVSAAIAQLASDRATVGANLKRLNFTSNGLGILGNNLSAANSQIADVDVAQESTKFARYQILQQAGVSMLAQANTESQSVLKLLGG